MRLDLELQPVFVAGSHPVVATPRRDARVRVDGKRLTRDGRGFRVQGVTYGPFAPGPDGLQFPSPARAANDFARMRAAEVNALRTYHVPPAWFLELAGEHDLSVFIDVPWPKHLCFLDSPRAQADARAAVRRAAKQGLGRDAVLALSIGNEVPADVVRWHGAHRVERFLGELADTAKQVDPDRLVTYASFRHLRQLPADRIPGPAVPRLRHFQRLLTRPGGIPPVPVPASEPRR